MSVRQSLSCARDRLRAIHAARIWLYAGLLMALFGGACAREGSSSASGEGQTQAARGAPADAKPASEKNGAAADTQASRQGAAGQPADATAGETAARKAITVNVSPVIQGDLVQSVQAEGKLRARRTTEIKFELTGTLERLPAEDGSRLRAGELIAVLDQREYQAAFDEARARHLRALSELAVNLELELAGEVDQTALNGYRQDVAALEADLAAGKVDAAAFRERSLALELEALRAGAFRRDVLEARTGFAEAKAAEERAQLNLERTEIRAPFAGTVTGLVTAAGERVYAGQGLCQLIDTHDLEAEVYVLESDLGNLQVGYPALLTIPAVEQTIPVRVSVVSPQVDVDSRTCPVLLRFTNESPRIRPGMFVRAQIATEVQPDRLLVPREAVLVREERPLVFKIGDDRALWVYVQTGARNDLYVEITGVAPGQTLQAGDRVVVSDHLTLAHEAAIKIGQTVQPDDPWRKSFASGED